MKSGITKAFIKSPNGENCVVKVDKRITSVDGHCVYILDADGVVWETHISNVLFMTTPCSERKDGADNER